jgi:hypothetical protein
MVITKHFLHDKLGLDFEIAAFFADRKIPAGNLYWYKRFQYLSFGTGFLFIPVIIDTLYKSGINKQILLNIDRITRMENAFDIVAQYEVKRIGFPEYIEKLTGFFAPSATNQPLLDDLLQYFNGGPTQHYALGTPVSALNRADAFLFTFTDLAADEATTKKLIENWYHVAVTVLMLDDLVDLDSDRQNKEENAVLELGDNNHALKICEDLLEKHLAELRNINTPAAIFFRKVIDNALHDEPIRKLRALE